MTDYVTDREQIETIKRWWNDYGKVLAIAILIGLIIGFGWRYWRQHKLRRASHASAIYQEMATAVSKNDEKMAIIYADKLIQNYANTPYASMAAFLWSSDAVAKKKYPFALAKLQWVIKNSDVAQFRQIARIRSAEILIQQNKAKQALVTLTTVDDKAFAPVIEEVKGDALSAQGDVMAAKKAYAQASVGLLEMGITNPLLTMKLVQPVMKPYSLKMEKTTQ